MGPISFLVAGLFNPFPEHTGQFLAAALMSLLGLVIVVLAGRSAAWHFLVRAPITSGCGSAS